jgi:hypothetical protein
VIGEVIIEVIGRVITEFVIVFIFRYPGALILSMCDWISQIIYLLVLIGNGPGDPGAMPDSVDLVKRIVETVNERAELSGWIGLFSIVALVIVVSQA